MSVIGPVQSRYHTISDRRTGRDVTSFYFASDTVEML